MEVPKDTAIIVDDTYVDDTDKKINIIGTSSRYQIKKQLISWNTIKNAPI